MKPRFSHLGWPFRAPDWKQSRLYSYSPKANMMQITFGDYKSIKQQEVATNKGRRNFSPWAGLTNTGKNNRRISTFHSTGGALSFIGPFIFFVNIIHIYSISTIT